MNHYCFKGRQNFQDHFRCLVAGGGTGDAAIFLAEQLRDSNAEIVYLDMSEASRQIAQQRAQIRGLDNIQWITASLLDIPKLELALSDYINCSGVLHHLPEPKRACKAWPACFGTTAPVPELYARLRQAGGVRHAGNFRALLPDTLPVQDKIDEARACSINCRPPIISSGNRNQWNRKSVSRYGDAGLYDLLLHRPATAPMMSMPFTTFCKPPACSLSISRARKNAAIS